MQPNACKGNSKSQWVESNVKSAGSGREWPLNDVKRPGCAKSSTSGTLPGQTALRSDRKNPDCTESRAERDNSRHTTPNTGSAKPASAGLRVKSESSR